MFPLPQLNAHSSLCTWIQAEKNPFTVAHWNFPLCKILPYDNFQNLNFHRSYLTCKYSKQKEAWELLF